MKQYELKTEDFYLNIEADFSKNNCIEDDREDILLQVKSSAFSAYIYSFICKSDFISFVFNLNQLYESLEGSVKLEERYEGNFIEFTALATGYIKVRGELHTLDFKHKLEFENQFDQTYLREFAKKLYQDYKKGS